jgi:hypothetical protein
MTKAQVTSAENRVGSYREQLGLKNMNFVKDEAQFVPESPRQ